MWRAIAILAVLGLVSCLLSAAGPVRAGDTLYYRGYFSAEATEIPLQGFAYRVDLGTIQPTFYYRYRTQPIPPAPSAGSRPAGPVSEGRDTAPLTPSGPTVLVSPVPLPGQYWYNEPGVYALQSHDLGWPYGGRR